MDAFFASVEVLDDPSLAGKPVIVGGNGRRGVVAACTYEARRFGVHSAMSSAEARRRCPSAIFIGGHYHRYVEVSGELHAILRSVTPLVEGISLDEAYLDVTGARRRAGDGADIANGIRRRVQDELRLTCSVGVGATKLVAKLASKAAKPQASRTGIEPGAGVVMVSRRDERSFLRPLPVRALPGCGAGHRPAPARARRADRRQPGRSSGRHPRAGRREGGGWPTGGHGRWSRRPPGRARSGAEVDRPRGDLCHRPLGCGRPPGAAPPDGRGLRLTAPRRRAPSQDGDRQGAPLRLLAIAPARIHWASRWTRRRPSERWPSPSSSRSSGHSAYGSSA